MKPVATRSIRKIEERPYTGIVTLIMDDPHHNYWKDIEPVLEKIFRNQLVALRILVNKTIYSSSFGKKITFKDKTLCISELCPVLTSLEYVMSYPAIVFYRAWYHNKYDIYECRVDEAYPLQRPY